MRKITLILGLVVFATCLNAKVWIVDKNGAGNFTTITAGIAAANSNDTVRVWPGTYNEQVNLSKNILLQGSGCENTWIYTSVSPAVTISAASGIMQWFMVSCSAGDGVKMTNGTIRNCVVKSCSNYGINCTSASGNTYITNCVIYGNGAYGVSGYNNSSINTYVTNCISWKNAGYYSYGFANCTNSYSNGLSSNTGVGMINSDPLFVNPESNDFHIPSGSPSWNTGQPLLSDPDGSRSDMGYFGGPDAPIYPVVYEILTTPNGDKINVQAKGRANW